MRLKKKKIDKVAVALVLCFSVVALTSIFTVKSSLDKLNLAQNNNFEVSPSSNQTEVNDASRQIPTVDSHDNPASSENQESGNGFISPAKGAIIKNHSPETPVYSKTLDQYMIHNGVDIKSDLDNQVRACAGGTVTKVFAHDMYGTTIEINHGNGYTSVYSNLSTDKMVEVGDVVTKGQVISGIGETALFEILDEPHLHFELYENGEIIDPTSVITFK